MTIAVVVLLLTPLSLLGFLAAQQALEVAKSLRAALATGEVEALLAPLPDRIERWLIAFARWIPGELAQTSTTEAGRWAAVKVQSLLEGLATFGFDVVMMLVALFFLLSDGPRLVEWFKRVSPIGVSRTEELLEEFRNLARSIIGANFVTGVAQATIATLGYALAGVPSPIFFGLLTLLASFIPSVGTAIVALPLALFLALMGHGWAATFLAGWSLLLVATVDNFLRPFLIKGEMHVHGALVFFSIIGGLQLFGVAGLVVGPMALTLFLTLMRFYRRDIAQVRKPLIEPARS